ncbi:MAG TPA: thermonuclease family protein [Stellaceae bacterium]
MQPLPFRPARLAPAVITAVLFLLPGVSAARAETTAPDAAPAAVDPAGDLPTVEVGQRPVHTVPEGEAAPALPVTIRGRDGSATALRAPPMPRHHTPSPPALTHISGVARVSDGVSLSVLGRKVRLFGVRPPAAGDLCPAGDSTAPAACSEQARGALIARLAANDQISCQVPPGQRAPVPAAVCHDASGADLARMLVADGFALADPTQSYDYFGAEAAARQLRRGLWHYR